LRVEDGFKFKLDLAVGLPRDVQACSYLSFDKTRIIIFQCKNKLIDFRICEGKLTCIICEVLPLEMHID